MQPQNGIDKKETAAGDTTAAHKNIGTNGAENSANGSAVNSEILRLSRLPYVEYQPEQEAHARRLGLPLDELNDRIARVKQSGLDELTPLPQLLDTVVAMLCKYVVFPLKAQAEVIALWTLHTWVFEAADFTPYLWITAASKRSGKTRVLDVLAFLAKNAEKDESASSASLIRSIDEKNPPTFLLDEIDKLYTGRANGDGEANNTCRLLNAGYERDATFRRCVGQGAAIEAKKFPAFCPKVICGIKCQIPDTVLDRSITIELVRQTRENRAERLRKREAKAVLAPIADKIKAWATFPGVIQDLKAARPELPDELHDRAQDICEPLLAIADLAGGNWPQSARDALVKLYKGVEDEDDGVKLLSAIKDIFDEKGCDEPALILRGKTQVPSQKRLLGSSQ
jgi:hypothetical protein